MDHFGCSNCKKRLGGERYVMRQAQPFCLTCFESMYAEYCDTCGERIETDQAQMAHESQHWHATDACFYCYTCRIPLHNRGFFPRYGALFCSNECALQRNNRLTNNTKLIPTNKFQPGPDIIPTSYTHTNQHVRILPPRPKTNNHQQQFISNRRTKEPTGYVSDGPGVQKYKRDFNNGYSSDGTGSRRYNRHQQPQVFLQFQTSPDSKLANDHQQKLNITRSRSREPIQFYNDLNLEQLDRHGATLEIARCSTSKSSRASLPNLSNKSISKPKIKPYSTISQETLVEQPNRLKNFDSNEIMYPISRPKSTAYSTSSQFPRSRSLNGSARFTKQHHVRFVDDENEKSYKRSPTTSHKSKKKSSSRRRTSSSSSSDDDDEQDDFNSIYQQFDIHGNRLRKPINYGTKISYVDECGLGTNTINPTLMKKSMTSSKKDKKSNNGRRKRDCIIS
jgi:hypothetical protein